VFISFCVYCAQSCGCSDQVFRSLRSVSWWMRAMAVAWAVMAVSRIQSGGWWWKRSWMGLCVAVRRDAAARSVLVGLGWCMG
jgi:hypothetical protein